MLRTRRRQVTLTALILWQLGMDSPVMWGGIVAVLNYIPYLGPIGSALTKAGGAMTAGSK